MDEVVEEITLISPVSANEVSTNEKLSRKTENIRNFFHSKWHLKQFILWIILFLSVMIISGPITLYISYAVPSVKPRNIANNIFSEERTLDYLNNLTQYGSRVSHTRGNLNARDYLISQIERICSSNQRHLQFQIDLQNFTNSKQEQLQNILVRVSNPKQKSSNISSLMLTAHYDSVEFSPGSCDDGSGVVILLELFSNLLYDLTLNFSNVNLIVLFTNAEESGLEGAKAFITNHIWRFDIRYLISVDSISCNEVANLLQTTRSQLVRDYSRVSRPRTNIMLEYLTNWYEIQSDYGVLTLNKSYLAYDFGFLLDGYTYHTPFDQPSRIKQGIIQDLGENLHILIRNILLGDVYVVENVTDTDPLIYFDILSRYMIIYKLSTSIIIQQILILLIIIVGIILISFDHIWHRQRTLPCDNHHCIYFHFENPFYIRIISIIIYFVSNSISIITGWIFSVGFSQIMSAIRPTSWYGNSTLAIFLFSFPYIIGFLTMGYLFDRLHRCILRKSSKIHFDFEQNFCILLVYGLLMIIAILSHHRVFYIILIWSIFICPIYLIFMILEFLFHWKKISWNFLKYKSHWLFLPLIISLFPLTHTIGVIDGLLRISIPLFVQQFSHNIAVIFIGNGIICIIIVIPTTFFVLVLFPIVQRIRYFGRILIILLISFSIIFIVAVARQPFTKNHPNTFYVKHTSKSIFKVEKPINVPFIVPLISKSSSITVTTHDGRSLAPILDHFSVKNNHPLQNRHCITSTNCTFDDTFNRSIAVKSIEITSMNYAIIIRHVLSYSIQISSSSPYITCHVRNQFNIPRTETILDITFNSLFIPFSIDIQIRRCDIDDSPFLLLFTRLMSNLVLQGTGNCSAIEDNTTLFIN